MGDKKQATWRCTCAACGRPLSSAKIFGQRIGNGEHSGFKYLQALRKGEAMMKWYQEDLDQMKFPGWVSERRERKIIRTASRAERGKAPRPKKGFGKIALRREKEEKRLAAKAAKGGGKKKA